MGATPMRKLLWHLDGPAEKGSETLKAVILAPVCVAIIGGLIAGVRWNNTTVTTAQVAQYAARDASLTRTPEDAYRRGLESANAWAQAQKLPCNNLRVEVDTSGYRVPLGQTGYVTVNVSCDVSFSDTILTGLPGAATVRKSGTSPIDPYRER